MSTTTDIRFFRSEQSSRPAEILDAALGVFAEHGYEGGSMRQIAEVVGISEPALYRHFSGKEDLFLTIIEQTGEHLRTEILPALGELDAETLSESIDALFEDRTQVARTRYIPVIQTILVASTHNPRFLEAYRDSVVRPMAEHLATLVPALDAHFGVTSDVEDVRRRVQTLIGMFIGHVLTTLLFDEAPSPISETVLRVMGWA